MSTQPQLVPNNTLITNTPDEGRALAIKLARLTIKATQPSADIRSKLRPDYDQDTAKLIAISQVVAIEFATVARANNYWRS